MSPTESHPVPLERHAFLDALRGFAIIWALGLAEVLNGIVCLGNAESRPWRPFFWIPGQLKHEAWDGFQFFDLIFPLILFLTGISIVSAIPRWKKQGGALAVYRRVVKRGLLLFALGVIYYGGVRGGWEESRWVGVLQRVGLVYLVSALLFYHFRPRILIGITGGLLLGYWAVMALVPIPALALDSNTVHDAMAEYGVDTVRETLAKTVEHVRGHYEPGLNVAHYVDALYLPGHRYGGYWDPEGMLGTLPAIATCMMGVLAGIFLQRTDLSTTQKVRKLMICGILLAGVGWGWGLVFPVIKLLWTSSFVLVAAGYSCLLLAIFLWQVEVKRRERWFAPLVWVGSNALLLYLAAKLVGFGKLAERILSSNETHWLDAHSMAGVGTLAVALVTFGLMLGLAHFLYRRRVFVKL